MSEKMIPPSSAPSMPPTPPAFAQWKKKSVWFLSSQAVSLFGSAITQFAIVWHITLSTSSGVMIMLSSLCSFLPQILVSLFAGVWADRHNRKHIIMLADGMIALATLVLALIFIAGYQELWLLFLVSAVRSVGAGLQSPAVSALIPQIVPQDKLMRVSGVNATIQSLTMLVSPAASGLVLSLLGLEAAFFIDVITAALAISIMSRLKVPRLARPENQEETGALQDLRQGLRYTWNHPFLRIFLAYYAGLMFLITPAALLTPLMTARSFGEEVWRLTANETFWSLGSLLGGILVAVWGGFKDQIRSLTVGAVVFGLFTMSLGFAGSFVVYLVLLLLSGLSMPLINASGMVLLQQSVEPGMQGRVFGLVQIVSSSAIPLGMLIFGPLADVVPIEWMLIATGLLIAVLGGTMPRNRSLRQGGTGAA